MDYLTRILNARVYDVAIETSLTRAPMLSARTGATVLIKREDEQPVFSFKLRGAYNKMVHLSKAQLKRGVIAASSGNHAQGVALSAQRLGVKAMIVMPSTTPRIKIEAVRAWGARVLLHGETYSEAYEHAIALAKRRGMTFIHPYDDPDVIAGQGTIGMEILRQWQGPLDAIFVAVGGGGLIAGIGSYVKAVRPEVKIVAVQPADSSAMIQSLRVGRRVRLDSVGLFADGVAVRQVGEETFRICREVVDDMITVSTDEICAAIKDVYVDCRSLLEPAGAVSIAGLTKYAERHRALDRTYVAVACGSNMNFDRLRFVAERAMVGEHREAVLAVTLPERPGSLRRFCELLGPRSVTEFNYRYAGPGDAHVFVGIEVGGRHEVKEVIRAFRAGGLKALDLTDNELAKLHVRHMVGGHAIGARGERVFRFDFPERPGALARFLAVLRSDWNISLFHYRNHGSDIGRVLVGLQIPPGEERYLPDFLKTLAEQGYASIEETANPAYRLFLGR
ncbi:MAG: threonine ammonia-lyase, biosynthetic [Casimicrobiaceae bacterium]|nr:threonine ammonia-lyase, biosynthetic [Casimicrobiaceae bacterium]MCX8098413.1 threonine ammonia-lyase, biosynthetic [Casimicrobiaceae bacterium]MDW8311125.1 threonine ammonia-lyase, biosynthetic [Burkholderiales bacterium]